jgi:hypothetical protein
MVVGRRQWSEGRVHHAARVVLRILRRARRQASSGQDGASSGVPEVVLLRVTSSNHDLPEDLTRQALRQLRARPDVACVGPQRRWRVFWGRCQRW